jgi:group II intron reverse transcriptase/maturase/CRISPR-associated endonuclease Cas1
MAGAPGVVFEQYRITLRLTSAVRFNHFLHGGVVQGLIRAAFGEHDLTDGIVPFAPESGHIQYRAGTRYHVGLTLIGEERRHASRIKDGLQAIGEATVDAPRVLGGNFVLDAFEQVPVPDVAGLAHALARHEEITVCFLSPLRLQRPSSLVRKGRAHLNQECFPGRYFVDRILARLRRLDVETNHLPPLPPLLSAEPQGLLWIDMPVTRSKPEAPQGITLGGVLGRVVLRGVPEMLLPEVVLGGLVHMGQAAAFGMGRYTFIELESPFEHCFVPARSLIQEAAEPEVLGAALDHLLADSDAAGVDGVTPDEFARRREDNIAALSRELASGRLRPANLCGFLQEKRDGSPRALAFPTVRERVAQRAVAQVLTPGIDTLLEDCSFAYRKGFSREGAARAIQKAYDAGFRVVLDADIEAFFDSVDWSLMFAKLRALLPLDRITHVLEAWIQAPVEFKGHVIHRHRGLPQGAPISPLLANLFLDEFDEQLLGKNFRLVRYADDFVVLCRDVKVAEQARRAAARALDNLALRLHENKTAVVSMDAGFSYLGYLFCKSLAIESTKRDEGDGAVEADEIEIPAASWLAQVPLRVVRSVRRHRGRTFELVPLVSRPGPSRPARKPLYVLSRECSVSVRGESLRVQTGAGGIEQVPIRDLSHVVFVGTQRATVPALFRLARLGVPSFFCYASGELEAVFGPHEPDWQVWSRQAETAAEPARRLAFCKDIVQAKLHNAATLVVRFKLGPADLANQIRALARDSVNKKRLETLRGFEGRGAALFFGALRDRLDDEWGFEGRRRRPAPDPINAMLSFGYTVLYRHLTTALITYGLNPRIGLFHEPRGTFHALAADLQEEFRYLVDALVWGLVSQRRVQPEDFYYQDATHGCRMQGEVMRAFVAALEDRLATRFTPAPDEDQQTYLDYMALQAWRLREYILGHRQTYTGLRAHA